MSDEDRSGGDKSFLARWSQRKQEAKQPEPTPDAPAAEAGAPSAPDAEGETAPEFDLSTLPKLEDMTATTDITAFLRKGVPEHLRNAALRKSWALDPAIRNYVNPALEYAYDWNTPGGVPGSSEIEAGMDVARLVSQIMGGGSATEPSTTAAGQANAVAESPAASAELDASHKPQSDLPTQALRVGGEAVSMVRDTSPAKDDCIETGQAQPSVANDDSVAPQQPVRRHGSAKPIV